MTMIRRSHAENVTNGTPARRDYAEVSREENRRMQQNMAEERKTAVEEIYDHLSSEINALRLLPGDRISEAEIATRFGVSRQPVRDAFARLANQDLLLIRPQRATEVKRFSSREIEKSRFLRASVESEVLRRAAARLTSAGAQAINCSIERQRTAIAAKDYRRFRALDYEFHRTLCDIAGVDFAFEVIAAEKVKVDRLCMLGMAKEDRMPQLLADHEAIAAAIAAGDAERAIAAGMVHLSRLDATINAIEATNAQYFEPDFG
ncbi:MULTISPECIES: GntR family transcriptional regulator [unclassified Marinovum]